MNERKLEAACMKAIEAGCPRAHLWKIHTETEGGRPDLEVAWNGHTTKIEFKRLKGDETVHDKWEDARQLINLVRYEQQTQRSWVVCYRTPDAALRDHRDTIIYRPTALLDRKLPNPCEVHYRPKDWPQMFWTTGAMIARGFDHQLVVELIKVTCR